MASTEPTAPQRDETLVQPVTGTSTTGRHTAPPTAREAVAAQRASFGGVKWGAAFFGWLSANGLAVLLISLLGAAGVAFGLARGVDSADEAAEQAETIGLGGAVAVLVVLVLAAAGAVAGAQYNVLQELDLPRIPVEEGTATTGALVTLGAVLLATLLAAMLGGKLGDRYHRKVDRAGFPA